MEAELIDDYYVKGGVALELRFGDSVQIAHKIHAATNRRIINDPKQNRARDIIDILLIELLGLFDKRAIGEAAERIFKERNEHVWPPAIIDYPNDWKARLIDMAATLGYPLTDANEIIQAFQNIIKTAFY